MRKALALLLTSLLIVTTLPTSVAADEPEPIAWGIEYDYSNLNTDIASMIGIDLQEVFQEVMNAGDDAGIDILIGSVTSGSTTIVFEQYDGPMKTLTVDGVQTDFSTKVTELTVRHGLLDDFAIHSEWSDSFGGIDLTIGYDSEQLFNADVVYTEYFDADMGLHGMDMEMDIEADIEYTFGVSGELSGDGETFPFDMELTLGTSYKINNGLLEVRMDEPSPLYTEQSALEAGEELHWSCDDDMADNGDQPYVEEETDYDYDEDEESTRISVRDGCAEHNINYETETSVLFELSGIPTEEFGLPEGDFDITISDTVTDMYNGEVKEFFMGGAMKILDEPTQMITIDDGSTIEVHQAYASPTPMAFPAMWGVMWVNSVLGSGDYPGIVDALTGNEDFDDAFGEWFDDALDMADDADDDDGDYFICANLNEIPYDYVADGYDDCGDNSDEQFICNDGEEIPPYYVNDGYDDCMYGEDETYVRPVEVSIDMYDASETGMEFDYQVWNMDDDDNYEIVWTVTDDEGTTSDSGSTAATRESYHSHGGYAELDGFGEYCLDLEVTRMSDDAVVATEQRCETVSQDIEPSDRLIKIVEALADSTLENTMESFGRNLENRLDGFDNDFDPAYEDAMAYALYDTNTDRFVGGQLVVSPGGTQWYTLIGPDSSAYGTPQRGVSVNYFTGIDAVEEAEEIEEQTDLTDLVDVTQHNTDEVEAVNEGVDPATLPETPEDGDGEVTEEDISSLLPFVSPVTTVAMIALAGMFVSIRSKDEE